ncbi:hypothetical protein ONA91_06115 [Micromonospora sp. DR5-3]|uniref:glucoamylase family protein n=1 Tax=unclassified Micromonospora TaxID=2617518 RepID=UPI0011DBC82C|nr:MULTISPECIES: glucoamylase family protein [unclassified Micromonospora]MCW3814030.1 hypothetical protein [Micromonospora sp. DR5-3]TYC23617.1 hypothetical protein FXF52_14710 [Micromonospora sp. MP36]
MTSATAQRPARTGGNQGATVRRREGGFYDAVNVTSGQVSERYLALDQGMVMAALGNALADDVLRKPFSMGAMKQRLAPLMRMEQFSLPGAKNG